MAVSVDIADRQFDYTDEEKAAEAVADVQAQKGLSDDQIIAAWSDEGSSLRAELERRIYEAVDANGSAQRARDTVPGGITLMVDVETT